MIYPSIDRLLNIVDSKYKLVHIAADRAKVMKEHKITMFMILFFFVGLLTLFYPSLSNYYNEKNGSKTISNYENILINTNSIDFSKIKEDAINYNEKLSKLKEPLLTYDTLKNYNDLLNINNDDMIGYLIIDKIKLYNGVEIPQVGLGTWLMNNEQVYENEKELNALKQIKLDIRW